MWFIFHILHSCFTGIMATIQCPSTSENTLGLYSLKKMPSYRYRNPHFKLETIIRLSQVYKVYPHSIRYHYKAVNYLEYSHSRHPISHSRHPISLLWEQILIYVISELLHCGMKYLVKLDRIITAPDCTNKMASSLWANRLLHNHNKAQTNTNSCIILGKYWIFILWICITMSL